MKNVLHSVVPVTEWVAILEKHRGQVWLPPVDAKVWRATFAKPAAAGWLVSIREQAEREFAAPLPVLTDELYALFHQTGERIQFEQVYFERRRRLARAVICRLADGPRWLPSVVAKVTDIFREESWSLPAHVTAVSGKDVDCLDLFCAETANLLGEVLLLCGAELPAELVREIRARLRTRVFENYLNRDYWWMAIGSNWNGVCHQGILGAALAAEEDQTLVARLWQRALTFLPTFLAGFTPDGGSSEGPGYWEYGFGWFCELNRQLESRTGGELSLFEGDEHIRAIARFGPLLSLANGHLVNFADGPASGRLRPALLQYLGERLDDSSCRQLARENYRQLAVDGFNVAGQRCDLFYLTRLFLACPADVEPAEPVVAPDVFLPDLAVLVARGPDQRGNFWEFAAKAGHNGEHHNHNDCGSYLLNVNGARLIIEIGAPEYTKQFFGEQRYEFIATRTRGHSLPVINGCEQPAGREFAARVLAHELSARHARFVVDLTACYPVAANCARCVRTFELDKVAGRLVVRDEFELGVAQALETAIITLPTALAKFHITPAPGTVIAATELDSYRGHGGQTCEIRRVVLRPRELGERLTLEYAITAVTQQ